MNKRVFVITVVMIIVVLLILAGVTIMYTMGQQSNFKSDQEVNNKIDYNIQKGQENITNKNEEQYNGINGNLTDTDSIKKGEIVKEDKKEYIDENGDKAFIPGGFCVVENSKDDPNDKNTVKDGLVISDVEGDDLDNSKHGNQFVWIPVEDYSNFHLIEGYYQGNLDTMLSTQENSIETVAREAGDTINAGSPGKPSTANSVIGTDESIAMYQSVKANKGFYIARFEAGIAGATDNGRLSIKTAIDGSVKPLSQKGVGVWNSIPWGGTNSIEASDNLPGNDNADGAVKVARSMYQNDGIYKATSTLCYGVQLDATMNFIDSSYITGKSTGYVKNSTNMGNYIASIKTTGSNKAYQQKHIYDMAGNVGEWTMEACYKDARVVRGGNYYSTGEDTPVSMRSYGFPVSKNNLHGFRLTLYL